MTDRPILFSGPMVRALLDGRKTQTRRVAKITAIMGNKVAITAPEERFVELEDGEFKRGICHYERTGALSGPYSLPFAVGDRLYVREAWRSEAAYDDLSPSSMGGEEPIQYEADCSHQTWGYPAISRLGRFRQGKYMPRWASRLTLIVTDVRVQRVQDISEDDADAEGWPAPQDRAKTGTAEIRDAYPIGWFAHLWDSLNAKRGYGWDVNPWVVAVSFTVERRNIDQMEATDD